MRTFIASIEAEYHRYKTLADNAMTQVTDEEFVAVGAQDANSIAAIAKHVGGNLASRFSDFLTTDGEKPWRRRDEEFEAGRDHRAAIVEVWERGWSTLFATLASLTDADLTRAITIRTETIPVHAALHRSLAHTASHVGQILFAAKAFRGADWESLSIPKGQSQAFNAQMGLRPGPATS